MTTISVVVERMMPSKVRKLRSLLERKEANATTTASTNDALACIVYITFPSPNSCVHFCYPGYHRLVEPEPGTGAGQEAHVATVLG